MTAARSVAVRTASAIRCVAIAYIAVQVVIWHSFYAAGPWRLAGPAIAAAWGTVLVAYLRRRPGWQLASADSGIHVALALGAQWCVPPAMRGDTANWLYIVMAGQLVVPAWFGPAALSAPLSVVSAAAYLTGAALAPGGSGTTSPAAAAALLLGVTVVAWCARRMLYRKAARADIALARADRESREQYVVLSRNIERREHERLLHDTVLNTLTALARPGSGAPGEVVGRCRHDVMLMEYVLSGPDDRAGAAGRAYGGLLVGIEAVATDMRARGLNVHVKVSGPRQAGATAGPAAGGAPAVPVQVAVAVSRAVREALANVLSHAGTGEAWVEVSIAASGGLAASGARAASGALAASAARAAAPAGLRVTVRDAGAGFDAAGVDPARLGLRRSIVGRIADCGGQASVQSLPGAGTVVILCWPGHQDAGRPAVASGRTDRVGLPW
jgi:signal transduction histidine kinase